VELGISLDDESDRGMIQDVTNGSRTERNSSGILSIPQVAPFLCYRVHACLAGWPEDAVNRNDR
jgi:hypothetical protein